MRDGESRFKWREKEFTAKVRAGSVYIEKGRGMLVRGKKIYHFGKKNDV